MIIVTGALSVSGAKPKKVTVPVVDATPVITITGSNPATINVGNTYIDEGATATDNVDGDITANITSTNNVDTSVAGTYSVTYDVSNSAGNAAIQKVRTVHVNAVAPIDTTKPIITITGSNPATINVGNTYIDAGATATDNVDGDITANITSTNNVVASVAGTYSVTYDVSDNAGNKAIQKVRTVHVNVTSVVDTVPPIIAAPPNVTMQAVGTPTHVTLGTPVVTDNIDTNPTVTNDAPAGSDFLVGETIVIWTACDHATPTPNCNNATQLVTITPASIKLLITSYDPPSLSVEDTAPSDMRFNITMNQVANVVWSLDGVSTQSKQLVKADSYRANFSTIGSHVLTVNVQNGTDSDNKTWNWNIKGTIDVSAHPAFVNIGQSTNVTFIVSRRCGIENGDNCTLLKRLPASGVSILLAGMITGGGVVNNTTGEFVAIVNETINGTINVTASKYNYLNAYANVAVGVAPIVVVPLPNSGGGSGGGSGGDSSSSSSGGGGGGGGTAEPYDNILKYEIQEHDVFTTPVSFKYVTPELGIYDVSVTSTQSEIAALRIEVLKSTSKLVGSPAPGVVYKNINAWMDYKRIKNATMKFKVENSWMNDNGLSADKIKMSKWENTSGKWIGLPTNVVDNDSTYTYLEAQTDSFSSFAINGMKTVSATTVDSGTPVGILKSVTDISPEPIATSAGTGKNSTKLQIGIVAIVAVLIFYMLRLKKN
jgi:PGF-pre-PGF domain-containing protein